MFPHLRGTFLIHYAVYVWQGSSLPYAGDLFFKGNTVVKCTWGLGNNHVAPCAHSAAFSYERKTSSSFPVWRKSSPGPRPLACCFSAQMVSRHVYLPSRSTGRLSDEWLMEMLAQKEDRTAGSGPPTSWEPSVLGMGELWRS